MLSTEKPRVLLALADEGLWSCLDRMAQANVGSILVAKDDQVLGILTERDVLRRWREFAAPQAADARILDLATKPVFTMRADQIAEAPAEMLKRGIRHVPLVDAKGRLVGIMSMRDVLLALSRAGTLPRLTPAPGAGPRSVVAVTPVAAAVKGTAYLLTPTAELPVICRRYLPESWVISVWTDVHAVERLAVMTDPEALKHSCFVLDLDGLGQQDWKVLLRRFIKLLTAEAQPTVFLIWSPATLPEKDVESLVAVATKARWLAYQRPLPVIALGHDLSQLGERAFD